MPEGDAFHNVVKLGPLAIQLVARVGTQVTGAVISKYSQESAVNVNFEISNRSNATLITNSLDIIHGEVAEAPVNVEPMKDIEFAVRKTSFLPSESKGVVLFELAGRILFIYWKVPLAGGMNKLAIGLGKPGEPKSHFYEDVKEVTNFEKFKLRFNAWDCHEYGENVRDVVVDDGQYTVSGIMGSAKTTTIKLELACSEDSVEDPELSEESREIRRCVADGAQCEELILEVEDEYAAGVGHFVIDDNEEYSGDFSDSRAHGSGVSNAIKEYAIFAGHWERGLATLGEHQWPGQSYLGEWKGGSPHGLGVQTTSANKYKGDWWANRKQGYGTLFEVDTETTYAGYWYNDERSGCGTEIYKDGGMYSGQWRNDAKHGFGIEIRLKNGASDTYYGEWNEGKRSGFGVCESSDGTVHTGEWKDDLKEGYGMTTVKNQTIEEGLHIEGAFDKQVKKLDKLRLGKCVEDAIDSALKAKYKASEARSCAMLAYTQASKADNVAKEAINEAELARIQARLAKLRSDE